jgi:hypothetical protein
MEELGRCHETGHNIHNDNIFFGQRRSEYLANEQDRLKPICIFYFHSMRRAMPTMKDLVIFARKEKGHFSS